MEEIRYKLESYVPSVVGSALARLTDIIKSKNDETNNENISQPSRSTSGETSKSGTISMHSEELDLLWSSCRSQNATTASMAVDFLLHLNTYGYLNPSDTVSKLLATSTQFKSTHALITALGNLLTQDFLIDTGDIPCDDGLNTATDKTVPISAKRFGIESNQHPFISLLRASPSTNWPHVLNIVRFLIESDKYNKRKICDFVRPVFLFVLCNPHENQNLATLRCEMRRILVKHYHYLEDTVNLVLEWTKYEDNPASFIEYVQFILDIFKVRQVSKLNEAKDGMHQDVALAISYSKQLPIMISLSIHAIKTGVSIHSLLDEIQWRVDFIASLCNKTQEEIGDNTEHSPKESAVSDRFQGICLVLEPLNICLIVLSKLLDMAPHTYLGRICSLGLALTQLEIRVGKEIYGVGRWQMGMFVSALLKMMSFTSSVTSKKLLNCGGPQILIRYRQYNEEKYIRSMDMSGSDRQFNLDGTWDREVKWSLYINKLINKMQKEKRGSNDIVRAWLSQIDKFESFQAVQKLFPVFSTILLSIDQTDKDIEKESVYDRTKQRLLIEDATLRQMIRCVQAEPSTFASPFLTLILYKLSTLSRNRSFPHSMTDHGDGQAPSNSFHSLLLCLPIIAMDRGCISAVLQIIQSLGGKSKLVPLQLKLLLELWKIENRCYPCLQKSLELNYTNDALSCMSAEISLAKAEVIKVVCETQSHRHGADLLTILSNILNQACSDSLENMEDMTKLTWISAGNTAIEGIIILCKEGVIDIATTVKVLSPKLKHDGRPSMLAKFVELLAIAPSFKLDTKEYDDFVKDTLSYLWKIAFDNKNRIVRSTAIKSLARFDLEYHNLKMMPHYAKERLKLPAAYCSTPMDAARKPEDVLGYIPGEAWTELLLRSESKEDLDDLEYLVCSMLKQEVQNFPKLCYSVSNKWTQNHQGDSPPNYNYLPEKTLLRAIISNLLGLQMNLKPITSSLKDDINAVDSKLSKRIIHERLLRILAAQDKRPLPPFDWLTFKPLLETHTKSKTSSIFPILIHQGRTSNSARVLMESILSSGSAVREVVADVFEHLLKVLITFVSPINNSINSTCEAFVNDAVQMWTSSALRDATARDTYLHIMTCCKKALITSDIDCVLGTKTDLDDSFLECSKSTICSALESVSDQLLQSFVNPNSIGKDVDVSFLYETYLDTVAEMPTNRLDKLTSPAMWWNVTDGNMYQAIGIRTRLACSGQTATPMVWLNECIDALAKRETDNPDSNNDEIGAITFDNLLRSISSVAGKTHVTRAQSNRTWLLELMGRIRSVLKFSSKSNSSNLEISKDASIRPNSNTAGGFHLLFDIFCLSIIIYSEVYGIIIPDREVFSEDKTSGNEWNVPLSYDLSLNSRWEQRLDLLRMAIHAIVSREELSDTKPTGEKVQEIATQLSEWFLQLLHAMKGEKRNITINHDNELSSGFPKEHFEAIITCLSAFKGANEYKEASMWGRLITAYCL